MLYDDTDNEVDVVNSKRKKREVNVDNAYNELIEDCTQHNDWILRVKFLIVDGKLIDYKNRY